MVQESPGTLEYEVALYREASPRSEDGGNGLTVDLANEIPVDQAVPIGTKLQLRATINDESGKSKATYLQVTLFQKLSFLNQLTHNMTKDCSLNSKNLSSYCGLTGARMRASEKDLPVTYRNAD